MSNLREHLKPNQLKGSKPRCHTLTHGLPEQVARQLNKLVDPCGSIAASDFWMPRGFDDIEEAQLHNAPHLLDTKRNGEALKSWWLACAGSTTRTPNWDIASTCTIEGRPGLLLVEAKAHCRELKTKDRCGSGNEMNYERIGQAIREANDAFNLIRPGWKLSHEHHYQLSNRFAWSWKLASLGIPVVLVYLGFLNANEMNDPFHDEQSWVRTVQSYARDVVPESVWDSKLIIGNTPLYALIRSIEIPLASITATTDELKARSATRVH